MKIVKRSNRAVQDIAAFIGYIQLRYTENLNAGKTDENGKPEYSAIIGESKQKNSFRRRGRKPKKKPRKENIRDEECGYSS